MKRFGLTVAALALSALAFAPGANAQARFGLAAGLAVPMGDFGDVATSGFNVEGSVEFRPATMPFGLRGDLFYNRFSADEDVGLDGNFSTFGGALNALFQMAGIAATPYLVVGPTLTNFAADINGSDDSETKIGAQGGIGVKFPLSGFTSKIEARYHTIFTDEENVNLVTINFGILSGGR
jgi:opacity protein-like surface antigen